MPRDTVPNLAANFAAMRSDYSAAKQNRFRRVRTGLQPMGGGADWHYRSPADYFRMMEYARDMDRSDMVVGQTIDRAVTNTIQDGLRHDPQTPDPGVNAELKSRFKEWAEDADQCDLAGERTFWEQQWLALRHCFVDGDVIALANESGALEMVEAHRCRTPSNTTQNVVHGILLDPSTRKRLEYWLTKDDVGFASVAKVGDIRKYPTRDADGNRQVFHALVSKRISQTRGVTALAPIFDVCGMVDDINFATLVQRQMVACFAIFRERELAFSMGDGTGQLGPRTTEETSGGFVKTLEGLGPGMQINGLPGEKLRMDSPRVPNPEYFPHIRLMLQFIGLNLGMPLVMVLMDASETNFSGWRGAIDQARLGFRHNQRRLRFSLCQPAYAWQVRRYAAEDPALAAAMERMGTAYFACRWNAPSWPYIQPVQDATADLLRLRNGLVSRRRWAAERGYEGAVIAKEIVDDNAQLIEIALAKAEELNAAHAGLNITWRELACLPTPDGVNIRLDNSGQN
jgi:capsid protein